MMQDISVNDVVSSRAEPPRIHRRTFSPGRYSALILWGMFIVIFGITKPDVFLTASTGRSVFSEGVVTAILALAFLVPLTTATYDLSVGAVMGLSLVTMNWFGLNTDLPAGIAAVIAVMACAVVGAFAGLLVVKLHVNSLIATLGVSQVVTSVFLKVSDNKQMIDAFSDSWLRLGNGDVFGIPKIVVYLAVLGLILWFVLEQTPLGRNLFAVGGNPEAARLAGVRTDAHVWGSLIAGSVIAGLAGVVYSMKVGVFTSSVGPGYLFPALAAVFFGASQFSRRPNVLGTLTAYFALAFGIRGLQQSFGTGTFWIKPLFEGASLVIAVAIASRPARAKLATRRRIKQSNSLSDQE